MTSAQNNIVKFDPQVGFTLTEGSNGFLIQYDTGATRPATNEEIILWKSLEAEIVGRSERLNAVIDMFQAAVDESNNLRTLLDENRGNALATVVSENVRHRREIGILNGKIQDAINYIHGVAKFIATLEIQTFENSETAEKYYTVSEEVLAELRNIATKINVQANDLMMPINERLCMLEDANSVAIRIVETLRSLVDSDGKLVLNTR